MGVLFRVSAFAIVVCRHPDGRWLAVRETKGRVPAQVRLGLPATLCSRDDDDNDDDDFPRTARRGWWLPAGGVEAGETFEAAAHRETREEAGIRVTIQGVLRVEWSVVGSSEARMRVVYFAVPEDGDVPLKTVADGESEEARWCSVRDLESLQDSRDPGLRGGELLYWARYVEGGGFIAPLSVLARESDGPPHAQMRQQFPSAMAPQGLGVSPAEAAAAGAAEAAAAALGGRGGGRVGSGGDY